MADDPFDVVKREVESSLSQTQELLSQWQKDNDKGLQNDIRDILRNIAADLDELEDTIKIVVSNPQKFRLDNSKIQERKQFVANGRKQVENIKAALSNPARQALLGQKKPETNQKYIEREEQHQQMLMQNQDRQMEEVAVTVRNLGEVARVMGDELDDQARLLDEVDEHVERTQNRLDDSMQRIKDFIKANADTKQQWTICGLIVVLVILLVLILSF
ncbi:t-SNARE [Gorgonomyces haynaldii]|nr:t-SNARE [Gorgonomyces haynaldii]